MNEIKNASVSWQIFNFIFTVLNGFFITYLLYTSWDWFVFPSFRISNPGFWILYGIKMMHTVLTFKWISENEMRSQLLVKKLVKEDQGITDTMILYQKYGQVLMFSILLIFWLNLYLIKLIAN